MRGQLVLDADLGITFQLAFKIRILAASVIAEKQTEFGLGSGGVRDRGVASCLLLLLRTFILRNGDFGSVVSFKPPDFPFLNDRSFDFAVIQQYFH
jgi:hypothetical protein